MRPQKRKRRRELSRPFEECQKINAKIFRSKFSVNDESVVCVEEHNRMMPTPERCDNSTHLDLIIPLLSRRAGLYGGIVRWARRKRE